MAHITESDVEGIKGLLLAQVENTGPSSILSLAPAPVAPVALCPLCPPPSFLLIPNHQTSKIVDTSSSFVRWHIVDLANPLNWGKYTDVDPPVTMANSNAHPPHNRPYPNWAWHGLSA